MSAVARRTPGILCIALLLLLTVASPSGGAEPLVGDTSGGRLLVVSLPGLTWTEVRSADLPALEAFVETAALADLAPRGVSARSGPGDGYLTISAGARATTERDVDGQLLGRDEQISGSVAGEVFRRRTGGEASGDFVALGWPSLLRRNAAQPFDAEPGLLANTLLAAGLSTYVIGNADGSDSISPSYQRQVGLALADPEGVVQQGALGRDLLVDDASRPFGVRLDSDAVLQSFDRAWSAAAGRSGGVVLVEASDLARTMRYRSLVSSRRYATIRAEALRDADALLAGLLDRVDLDRDSVLVVAPYSHVGSRDLTAVALRTPTSAPGYLMSASTQRAGYLTLVDIGPTILDRYGITRPAAMEGRPAEVVSSSASGVARVERLEELNEASRFRERLLTPTTLVVVLLLALVAAGAAVVVVGGRSARWRETVALLALVDLAVLPLSYVARGFALEERGMGFYWVTVLGGAVLAGGGASFAAKRLGRPNLALAVILALVAGVLVADVTTGSRLSLNAAFGYSPTGNSRLYGISNYSFGQLAAAVCLLAALVASVGPMRRARPAAVALLVAAVVVLGVPTWGADVGGILALTPAMLVFAAVVFGRRIRLGLVAAAGIAGVLATVAFGFLDLARPASQRAHLGRLFERIGDEGLDPLLSIMERKLAANMSVSTSSFWVAALPLGAALLLLAARHPSHPLARLRHLMPGLSAGLAAALVGAVLGSILNDSGLIVGGVAMLVVTASVAHLLMVHEGPPAPG